MFSVAVIVAFCLSGRPEPTPVPSPADKMGFQPKPALDPELTPKLKPQPARDRMPASKSQEALSGQSKATVLVFRYTETDSERIKDLPKTILITGEGDSVEALGSLVGKLPSKMFGGTLADRKVSLKDPEGLLALEGEFTGKKTLRGTATRKDGQKISWTATISNVAWQCGNHTPPHLAASQEEMQRLTKQNGCTDWSRVQSTLGSKWD